MSNTKSTKKELSFQDFKSEILADYLLAWQSRHASTVGRKEVLTGKAKFGIFGAGKELAQIALAKFFEKGDSVRDIIEIKPWRWLQVMQPYVSFLRNCTHILPKFWNRVVAVE
jgi:hypothetical protein